MPEGLGTPSGSCEVNTTYITTEDTEARKPASRRNTRTLRIDVMTIMPPLLRPGQVSIFKGSLTRKARKECSCDLFLTMNTPNKQEKAGDFREAN